MKNLHQSSCRWLNACLIVSAVIALCLSAHPSAADASSEYDVKAAFILNFARFVEWPETSLPVRSTPLVIAIVGNDPFGGTLEHLIADKTINAHPLILKKMSGTADLKGVAVAFISRSEHDRAPAILKTLEGASVLTVSDMDGFCEMGGIIHLSNQDQRIRFEVNLVVARQSGLNISSKLLGLARTVYTERRVP